MEYVDHLREHMKTRVKRKLESFGDNLPIELADISQDRLIDLITEHATPILRKIEDDAIYASMSLVSSMIRFANKKEEK